MAGWFIFRKYVIWFFYWLWVIAFGVEAVIRLYRVFAYGDSIAPFLINAGLAVLPIFARRLLTTK